MDSSQVTGFWDVMVMVGLLVCVVIGLCLWCIWILFSKKTSRTGGKKNSGSGKSWSEEENAISHMIGDNDEEYLVDNEEEPVPDLVDNEEEPVPDAMDIKDEPVKGATTIPRALYAWNFIKNCVHCVQGSVRLPVCT